MAHYEKQGNGKTMLMLHGWADQSDTFRPLLANLSNDYTLITLDLPGFGRTEAPKEIWDLDNYSAFIADFLEKINNLELFAMVGHSNGGAVAIRGISLGLLHPQKLVLLAASGVRDTDKFKRAVIKIIAKAGKVLTFWLPPQHKKKLQKILYGTVGSDMMAAPQLKETFKKTVRQDIQKDASNITIPTLLIYGSEDTATPINSVGNRIKNAIPNSEIEIIEGADHFVHLREPKKTASRIKEFLSQ